MDYEFTLKFKLPTADADVDGLIERLAEAGCDDALVGTGLPGRIALDFTRDSDSASDAVLSAIRDVQHAIPGAKLIEASPDYVGLTDVAELVGVTRQNMRKLVLAHTDFPCPVHAGSTQVWHLESVLRWLNTRAESYRIEPRLLDVARVTMQCNLTKEADQLESMPDERIRTVMAG